MEIGDQRTAIFKIIGSSVYTSNLWQCYCSLSEVWRQKMKDTKNKGNLVGELRI